MLKHIVFGFVFMVSVGVWANSPAEPSTARRLNYDSVPYAYQDNASFNPIDQIFTIQNHTIPNARKTYETRRKQWERRKKELDREIKDNERLVRTASTPELEQQFLRAVQEARKVFAQEEATATRALSTMQSKIRGAEVELKEVRDQHRRISHMAPRLIEDASALSHQHMMQSVGDLIARKDFPMTDEFVEGLSQGRVEDSGKPEIEHVQNQFQEDQAAMGELQMLAQSLTWLEEMDLENIGDKKNLRQIEEFQKLEFVKESDPLFNSLSSLKINVLTARGATGTEHQNRENLPQDFSNSYQGAFTAFGDALGKKQNVIQSRVTAIDAQIESARKEMDAEPENVDLQESREQLISQLERRREPLTLALLAGKTQPDGFEGHLAENYGWSDENPPNRNEQDKTIHTGVHALAQRRKEGRSQEEIDRLHAAIGETPLVAEDDPSSRKEGWCFGCALGTAWDVTKGAGGALWTGTKAVGSAIGGVASFFSENAEVLKQSMFAVLSAAAQHQYMRHGSKNENTQVYRALAITLGLDMGFKGQMPRSMVNNVDPLEPYKRQPVSFQDLMASQDQVLASVLTIGGNPALGSRFPNSINDRLQSVVQAGAPSPFPQGVGQSFNGIVDPNFRNFAGQAYNGYPPQANLNVGGAFLNPAFGAGNPFANGSGLGALNFNTVGPGQTQRSLGNLLASTQVQRQGIQNFRQELNTVNPPNNSLKSLIDHAGGLGVQNTFLRANQTALQSALEQSNASFINNQLIAQHSRLNAEYKKLSQLNVAIFDASQQFRLADIRIQNDEDGLMIGPPRDWSKNFGARNQTLMNLIELRDKRAQILETIALIKFNPAFYERLLAQEPQIPQLKDQNMPEQEAEPFTFFWIPKAYAEETQNEPRLVANWRELVEAELKRTGEKLNQTQKKLQAVSPKLREMVDLEPKGVHEVNLAVVEAEMMNMKSLVHQTQQNTIRV